ncbi:MAG: hypothetical protein K0M67_08670, partial [Thiobacillus sp.]|nr:hypothetical protein [Thiobacillus sp.]
MITQRPVLGATLFSACGALPSHLMPVLLLMWIATGKASTQSAGVLAAAHAIGILVSLVVLPATGTLFPRRSWLFGAAGLLLSALVVSYWIGGPGLLLAWWLAGICAGLMQYVGSVVCSQAINQRAAFALRLAVSLLFAGCAILIVVGVEALGVSMPLVWLLVVLEAVILCFALCLLKDIPANQGVLPPWTRHSFSAPGGGLLVLFALFLGQVGFYVYVLKSVSASGELAPLEVAVALALAKLTVSLVMYALIRKGNDLVSKLGFVSVACALIAAVLLLGQAKHVTLVVIGFVLWELCFNALVAAFQGELAKRHQTFVGMWASVPVFLGAAAGPAMHGWLLERGWGAAFLLLAVLSALGPVLWVGMSTGGG